MKLNEELVFEWNDCLITNPYVCVGQTWIECDPFEEYGKTHEELLTIFKTQEYLDWLKEMGNAVYDDEEETHDCKTCGETMNDEKFKDGKMCCDKPMFHNDE